MDKRSCTRRSRGSKCSKTQIKVLVGPVALLLPREGLERCTESLSSIIVAESSTAEDETVSLNVKVSPEEVSDNPLTSWDVAPDIAAMLYSAKRIPPSAWENVLSKACKSDDFNLTAFAKQLSDLLAYLNLPGDTNEWLPRTDQISLQHARLLAFVNTCYVRKESINAVKQILQHKPHEEWFHPADSAVFLSVARSHGFGLPASEAHVIRQPPLELTMEQ